MTKPYKEIIKAFEEDLNRHHLIRVKNVKVGTALVSADIHIIFITERYKEEIIYYKCIYLKEELENRTIFKRTHKSRWNAY